MPKLSKEIPLYIKTIIAIVSIVIYVFVIEATLRITDPELNYKNQFFPVNRDIDFPEFYEKDPKLFWKLRAGETMESRWFSDLSYSINSDGLRGSEITNKKPKFRVLALGNSCTFGWGVPFDSCWTSLLENLLIKDKFDVVEVVNAGVPGYSSFQGKILFEKLQDLKPDVALIMFGWNDHWRAGKEISDAEQNLPPEIIIDLQNIFSKLRLYKLLRKFILELSEDTTFVRMDDNSGKRRVSRQEFFDNLIEMIKFARTHQIIPILLEPPIASLRNYNLGSISNLHQLHENYQKQVLLAGDYLKVPVVALQKEFDKYNNLFDHPLGDPIHFNTRGHVITAKAILPVIESTLTAAN